MGGTGRWPGRSAKLAWLAKSRRSPPSSSCAGSRCPSIEGLGEYDPDQASKVYAADGRLITDFGLERRTVVPLREISPAVLGAFLATEDKRFYRHGGIDWIRFIGAVKNNILAAGPE